MASAVAICSASSTAVTMLIFFYILLHLERQWGLKGQVWETVKKHSSDFLSRVQKDHREQEFASELFLYRQCIKTTCAQRGPLKKLH